MELNLGEAFRSKTFRVGMQQNNSMGKINTFLTVLFNFIPK